MAEIVLNRFKIEVTEFPKELYFFEEAELDTEKHYLARYKPTRILQKWNFLTSNDLIEWINNKINEDIKKEEFIYVSFLKSNNSLRKHQIEKFSELPFSLQKQFLKEIFITQFKTENIIEPQREGVDFSVYYCNDGKTKFTRIDIILNKHDACTKNINYEAIISVGSTDTYITKLDNNPNQFHNTESLKYVTDNLLIKPDNNIDISQYYIKANNEIRKQLNITTNPKRKFYKEYYTIIKNFVETSLSKMPYNVKIHSNFQRISELKFVSFDKNKMVFKDGQQDYSTINGMRDYGPYKAPDKIKETKLLFIYPDRECVNRLYNYLSRGYRHFPGLESYVGIPANIHEIRINYENDTQNIIDALQNNLTKDFYSYVLAVCIMPFSKSTATQEESKMYFSIKKFLLEKNIPSQFIHRNKIFEENFHFSLPNIAISMLAKCGGTPWKLARPHYNQLTIGFNTYKLEDETYLGSAVFFNNEGLIKQVNGYKGNSLRNICETLVNSINQYRNTLNENEIVNNVVIHFFKSVNNEELREFENIIKNTLGDNSNFAIIEINDTKSSSELCFDLQYESYMPQSGLYVKLKPYEYLLFNNLRYWESPINPINQEELPVKLRIYDPHNSFNPNELISQVYEYSRMYWKSLKQKSQPVTTLYSKLIAQYVAEFGGTLPDTEVAKTTVWFI